MIFRKMKQIIRQFVWITTLLLSLSVSAQEKNSDSELLGRAIDYFQGGKYHEALGLFGKLDKRYHLNPRFQAYIGVCHYYEWEYEQAIAHIDSVLPQLEVFAPHERSLYYFVSAESHFNLSEYEEAIPMYERHLTVCFPNERGDSHYRLGFCHMLNHDIDTAYEQFKSALLYYKQFPKEGNQARLAQTEQMIKGLEDKLIRRGGYFP